MTEGGQYVMYSQDNSSVIQVGGNNSQFIQPQLYSNPSTLPQSHSSSILSSQAYYPGSTLQPFGTLPHPGTLQHHASVAQATAVQPTLQQPARPQQPATLPLPINPTLPKVNISTQKYTGISQPAAPSVLYQQAISEQATGGSSGFFTSTIPTHQTQPNILPSGVSGLVNLPNGAHSHIHTVADVHHVDVQPDLTGQGEQFVTQDTSPSQPFISQHYIQHEPEPLVNGGQVITDVTPAPAKGMKIVRRIIRKPVQKSSAEIGSRTTSVILDGTTTPVRKVIRVVKKKVPIKKGATQDGAITPQTQTKIVRKVIVKNQNGGLVNEKFVDQVQAARRARAPSPPSVIAPATVLASLKPATATTKVVKKTKVVKIAAKKTPAQVPVTTKVTASTQSVDDHTQTRVRVVHVTEAGTKSIRVDEKKATVIKPTTNTIQTQTYDVIPALVEQPRSIALQTDSLPTVPVSLSTTAEQKLDKVHAVIESIIDNHKRLSQDQIVWNAKVDSQAETASESDIIPIHDTPEYVYASVIKSMEGPIYIAESVVDNTEEIEEAEPAIPEKSPNVHDVVEESEDEEGEDDDNESEDGSDPEEGTSAINDTGEAEDYIEEDPYNVISEVFDKPLREIYGDDDVADDGTESAFLRIKRIADDKKEHNVYENLNTITSDVKDEPNNNDAAKSEIGASSYNSGEHSSSTLGSGSKSETDSNTPLPASLQAIMAPKESKDAAAATIPGITALPDAKYVPPSIPAGFRIDDSVNVFFHRCDITRMKTDVIVSAANSKLKHDHGVAHAIVKVGGKDIEKGSKKYIKKSGKVEMSDVVSTKGGNLYCSYIFHAVCPKYMDYQDKNECKTALRRTYDKVFDTCMMHKVPSVSLPPLSSGKFAVPHYFISACIYESLLAAAVKGNYKYLKEVHIVNLEPSIILPVVDAFIKKPVVPSPTTGTSIIVSQLERQQVKQVLEQRKIPRKSKKQADSSKSGKDSKVAKDKDKKSSDSKKTDANSSGTMKSGKSK